MDLWHRLDVEGLSQLMVYTSDRDGGVVLHRLGASPDHGARSPPCMNRQAAAGLRAGLLSAGVSITSRPLPPCLAAYIAASARSIRLLSGS